MGKFIADKTIKEMIKVGKFIKNSNVLILGFTFKENCSDVRNTRVIDIIKELNDFGAKIDVFDPWVLSKNKKDQFKFISDPIKSIKKYDAIIVAVSHDQFKSYSSEDYAHLTNESAVLIDIKNIVKNPTWRL